MQPIPYLFFRDTCAEAFGVYAEVFGSDSPELIPATSQIPDAPANLVMHAAVRVGEGWLHGADDFSGGEFVPMAGVSISVTLPDLATSTRVFAALSAGGEVRQPLMATFFSPGFGFFTDRFGVRWMINTAPTQE